MPMLGERLEIFNAIGETLEDGFGGRFHRFLHGGPSETTLVLHRLIEAFPSFRDESEYRGKMVQFQKRAQLLLWQLHARFRGNGYWTLDDPERLTIFADYIVPVALRLFGITSYSDELELAVQERRLIEQGSEEETHWPHHLTVTTAY